MNKVILFAYVIFFLLTFGCTNKKVQLPKIEIEGIPEIQNHSSIWIFLEIRDQDTIAVLNKNNKILNTHWIFNIDRRLPMVKIIPFLKSMQENKNKDSMHKNEGMLNYFTFANTRDKSISLVIFNPTTYIFNGTVDENISSIDPSYEFIEVDLQNDVLFLNKLKLRKDELIKKLNQIQSQDSLINYKIIFKYSENTTFQNYLTTKSYLLKTGLNLVPEEFVYSLK
jgi:hypothetical protein